MERVFAVFEQGVCVTIFRFHDDTASANHADAEEIVDEKLAKVIQVGHYKKDQAGNIVKRTDEEIEAFEKLVHAPQFT